MKLLVSSVMVSFSAVSAQNGISIDKIKEDPYFASGSAFNPESAPDSGEEEKMPDGIQMNNPDDPDTFYNSENWNGGLRDDFPEDQEIPPLPPDVGMPFSQPEQPENQLQGDSVPGEAEGERPLDSDMAAGLTDSFSPKNMTISFGGGYLLLYSPTFLEKSFASYFDRFFGFQFLGADAWAEYLFWGKDTFKAGFGAYGSYTYLTQKKNMYEFHAHQFTADILFVCKLILDEGDHIEIRAGGGFLGINDLYYIQPDNGIQSEHTDWLYPEVRAGASYELFIYDHVGFSFGADLSWPFMFDRFYPRLEIMAGVTGRF